MPIGNVKRVLRSPREIKKMRAAGLIVWQAHQAGAKLDQAGHHDRGDRQALTLTLFAAIRRRAIIFRIRGRGTILRFLR